MTLTPKQEKFAQLVADGKTQADAYRGAFDTKPKTKPETIQNSACKLMANPIISARVSELKQQMSNKALWTREESVDALKNILNSATESVAVSAIKELNLMHGYNAPTKHEINGNLVNEIKVKIVRP